MTNLRKISKSDLKYLADGGAVLGAGGGGDPYVGRLMAEHALGEREIEVVSIDDLPDDGLVLPIAMMGAPQVMLEKFPSGQEFADCVQTMEMLTGRKVSALYCIEAGGLNSVVPFIAAASLGLPIVDGDAMGRAYPELQMVSFTLGGISATPMAMFDDKGNSATFNTISNQWTERLARAITIEMGGAAIVALYPVTAAQARDYTIKGSLTRIHRIGRLMEAHGTSSAPAIADDLGGAVLFQGRVRDVERVSEGGFTKGVLKLEGQDLFAGRHAEMRFQNEFLSLEENGAIRVTTPDLLTLIDANTGRSVPADVVKYGLSLHVLGLPSPEFWTTPEGLALVGPRYFGLDTEYKPLAEAMKQNTATM